MGVPAVPLPKSSREATTASRVIDFIKLLVMVGFMVVMVFQLGLTTFIAQQSYEGRTEGAITIIQPRLRVVPITDLGSTCKTIYFYKPADEVLEGVTYVPGSCPDPKQPVEILYDRSNPTNSVIPLNGHQKLLLGVGVFTTVGVFLLFLLSLVLRRHDQALVDAHDPYMQHLNALTSKEVRNTISGVRALR
ncbi:MAG: hypothetical protein Q4D73_07790 [Actinomycetaceae bacterium]|nr:hypothetical protein [Actinomycetaceae bacterium]